MNKISISDSTGLKRIRVTAIKNFCKKILVIRKIDGWQLSVHFCPDDEIAALNKAYRGKEGPTDVLSFSQSEGDEFPVHGLKEAGDIVISLAALGRNCDDFHVQENEELKRLLIHGILHLEGFDHATNEITEPMIRLQEEIIQNTGKESLF